MVGKSKKPNLLKNSMQGAKSRFDERLEKAQNVAILSGEEAKDETLPSKPTRSPKTVSKPRTSKSVAAKKPKPPSQKIPTQLDSFKFPVDEHKQIQELILDYAKRGEIVNKSEVIRLGLIMLKKATVSERIHALDNLQRVRVGRPPGS